MTLQDAFEIVASPEAQLRRREWERFHALTPEDLQAAEAEQSAPVTRTEAEAIEAFGDDLRALLRRLDRALSGAAADRFNTIANVQHLDAIAEDARQLGDRLCRECDEAADQLEQSNRGN